MSLQPFDYLNTCIKSYLRKSKIRGIGLFALVDIKKGEKVFRRWKGKTAWYTITSEELSKLPVEVSAYILRSYSNDLSSKFNTLVDFRLIKDTNFLFSEPLSLLNTAFEEGNVDSWSGIALRDIKKDEELTGNYRASSQIKLI